MSENRVLSARSALPRAAHLGRWTTLSRHLAVTVLTGSLLAAPAPALPADSVVLGRGIINYFLSKQPCPEPEDSSLANICMDSNFIWVLLARRTIVGSPVKGTVRAISSQHVAANSEFVRSTELFVLRRIDDAALRKSSHADYYLVDRSAKDSDGRFCLWSKPEEVGLRFKDSDIVAGQDGQSCFDATLITEASKSRLKGLPLIPVPDSRR
jgi:hypothetical protein